MAEDVVVKEQLTRAMVAAGLELTRRLRLKKEFGLLCSLWLYALEFNRWNITIGTPLVETKGPLHAFKLVESLIGEEWPNSETPLYTASLIRSSHPLVLALRSLGHYEAPDLPLIPEPLSPFSAGKRITLTKVQDVFIEDALIYYVE